MESVTPRPIAVFTFILQPEILLVWSLVTLVLGILLSLPVGYLMLLSLPFWVVLGILVIQYGFVIIEFTARGHHNIPRMSADVFAMDPRLYRQALVIVTMVSLVYATAEPWRFATLSIVLMVTPAMTAFVTFHLSLIRVFDPRHIWQFIRSMGYTYVTLRVLITSILMILLLLTEQVVHLVDITAGGFLMAATITYLLLTLFRGTGALLHSRRSYIGINTDFSLEQAQQELEESLGEHRRTLVADLALLCRRDRWQTAWGKLSSELKKNRYAEESEYYEALTQLQDQRLAWKLAQGYIGRLLRSDSLMAWEVFTATWHAAEGNYKLESGSTVIALARCADTRFQKDIILDLIDHFDDDYPRHPKSREAYLLASEMCCDLEDFKRGRQFFNCVTSRRGAISRRSYKKCHRLLAD